MIKTPVAFLIFNRPALTQRVFERIRESQPPKLLVVADGPRSPEEVEICQKTRSILEQVDWDCEVLTNFSDHNLGCKNRIASGLDWVFSEVPEAIVLEDDCLPTPSFFPFCEALLEHYREDERVMAISGDNFQNGTVRSPASYYFSKYCHVWGWASWRRAWQHYDVTIKTWPTFKQLGLLQSFCENRLEEQYWSNIFDRVYQGDINTWDYQWLYTCWTQNGLIILPETNLISNIGFGASATHTHGDNPSANLPVQDIWDIIHPSFVTRKSDADRYTLVHHYGIQNLEELTGFRLSYAIFVKELKHTIRQWIRRTSYG